MPAHAVSLRVRRTIALVVLALAAVLLLFAGSERADAKAKAKANHAKVTKGPKGLKFYKPPKKLPKQHGALIWARKTRGSPSSRTPSPPGRSSTPPAPLRVPRRPFRER